MKDKPKFPTFEEFSPANPEDYATTIEEVCGVLDMETIEAAAIKCLENFGTPDISGGLEVDEDLGVVYFKNAMGYTSLMMTIDAFNEWREANDPNKK